MGVGNTISLKWGMIQKTDEYGDHVHILWSLKETIKSDQKEMLKLKLRRVMLKFM